MKILWLSHFVPYPPKGGALQRSYNLIREVAKAHDIHLLAFIQKDLILSTYATVEEGLAATRTELEAICRTVRYLDIPSERTRHSRLALAARSLVTRDPYTINWLKSADYADAISAFLATNPDVDCVHFDTISLAVYHEQTGQLPAVLTHHNIESHMLIRRARKEPNLAKKLYYLQEGRRLARYEQAVCRQFDVNVTCSDVDTDRLQDIDSSLAISMVPNGVDTDYFRPRGLDSVPKRLIFAGNLKWYPNSDAMLHLLNDLWPHICERIEGVTLDIVGANPGDDLISAAGRYDNVNILGYVDDVRPYIDRADAYICPIRDGGGTKLKILDAFAMGKAVIAHPVACEGIDVSVMENVMFATSAEEYAEALARVVEDREFRTRLGTNARRLVLEKYDYNIVGGKLAAVFSSVADS